MNGKQKGAEFERAVCQKLSLWVSNCSRKDVFWRSAMSGGRANTQGVRKAQSESQYTAHSGDIVATHSMGSPLLDIFVIECKFYKRLELQTLLYNAVGTVLPIWETHQELCKRHRRLPLLVVKENRRQELIFVDSFGYDLLRLGCANDDAFVTRGFYPVPDIHVLLLTDLLTEVNWSKIIAPENKDAVDELLDDCRYPPDGKAG